MMVVLNKRSKAGSARKTIGPALVLLFAILISSGCSHLVEPPDLDQKSEWYAGIESPAYPQIDYSPSWSPDGTWIAYYHNGGSIVAEHGGCYPDVDSMGIYIIPSAGGQRKMIATGWAHDPSWTPDGRSLLFVHEGKLNKYNLNTGELQHITEGHSIWSPHQHPTENMIVYASSGTSSIFSIWTMDTLGGNIKQVRIPRSYDGAWRGPSWHPTKSRIISHKNLRGDDPLHTQLYLMDANGRNQKRFSFTETEARNPTFSSDGEFVAFESWVIDETRFQIAIQDTITTDVMILTSDGGLEPSWSPDGLSIVYSKHDYSVFDTTNGHLWVMNRLTGTERQLTFRSMTPPPDEL
ncbi:MAG: PD40 domain-containing protein [Candidatus Marinimicrobia bacterium]|nr:PD40 domain-containing protein [Candidatus Neomarinimicrobiota bacterium]